MQNSLFGGFDDGIEIATPPIPKTDIRWSDIERLNKERDLVGIYLSAHPLDEYKIVLDNLCNTKCSELESVKSSSDREDVVVGGIVNAPEGPMRRGQEKGHFDLNGSTIVLLLEPGQIELRPELAALMDTEQETRVEQGQWVATATNK